MRFSAYQSSTIGKYWACFRVSNNTCQLCTECYQKRPYVDEMVTPAKLRKVLPRADFLLMCAPDTDASHHMIAAPELDLMKKPAR